MPFIRVNCPRGALTAAQKAKLAPRLLEALIQQEIDPVTDIGRAATGFLFNEIDVENCFPGGVPLSEHPEKAFWIVEAFVAASYFSQKQRDAIQTLVAEAKFVRFDQRNRSMLSINARADFCRVSASCFPKCRPASSTRLQTLERACCVPRKDRSIGPRQIGSRSGKRNLNTMRDSFWHCNWGRCAQSRHPCWSFALRRRSTSE